MKILNLNPNPNPNRFGEEEITIKIKIKIKKTAAQLLALVAVLPLQIAAQETNAPVPSTSRLEYQSFRIISERNIFNPNRSGRSDYRSYTRREPDRRTRSTAFGLIGTMSYEKGRFAFFDGTSSEFRKVLQPDDSIAGYKIAEIGPNHVTLQGNGKEVHLEVGGRMKKQQEGDWTVSDSGESFESFTSETAETPPSEGEKTEGTPAASAPVGEVSDVIKRLMQKREQELQNEKK